MGPLDLLFLGGLGLVVLGEVYAVQAVLRPFVPASGKAPSLSGRGASRALIWSGLAAITVSAVLSWFPPGAIAGGDDNPTLAACVGLPV